MKVRDAVVADIPALELVKKPAALHKDRIRDAASGEFRYLVLEDDSAGLVGHACLVFRRPAAWPPDDEPRPYPRVIDLEIAAPHRRQGFGREFVKQMESICRQMRYVKLYLSVDPENNSPALAFYRALGYKDMQDGPQWRKWSFKDSEGNVHHGEGLDLDMCKDIA